MYYFPNSSVVFVVNMKTKILVYKNVLLCYNLNLRDHSTASMHVQNQINKKINGNKNESTRIIKICYRVQEEDYVVRVSVQFLKKF